MTISNSNCTHLSSVSMAGHRAGHKRTLRLKLIFKPQTSRSVYQNQRDELYLMAASRASGDTWLVFQYAPSNKKKSGGGGERQPTAEGAPPLSKLQEIFFLLLHKMFIRLMCW